MIWANLQTFLDAIAVLRKPRVFFSFACVFGSLCLFGSLSSEVLEQEGFPFDEPILWFLRARATERLDRAMLLFSIIGSYRVVVPLVLAVFGWLLWTRRHRAAVFWVAANLGTVVLNSGAKLFFGRPRPTLWESISPETSLSFPSGHAMSSLALGAAVVALLWYTKWRWPAVALTTGFTALVGLSRMYLGVHFPSDILAGWTASLAWVMLLAWALIWRGSGVGSP